MGLATAAVGLIGAGVSAIGAAQQGAATSASDTYQAQVAANNAKIAQQNATTTMQSGEIAAQNSGLQARSKIGTMTATMGANGIDVNTGSNAAVRAGADQTSYLDANTTRENAARQAYGFEVNATSDTAQENLDEASAKNATTAGDVGAVGTLLSGATSVSKSYAGYQNSIGNTANGGYNLAGVI